MEINEEKLSKIEEAQKLARKKLEGKLHTNITLWDDGDYRVEVNHGNGDYRESIFYRSQSSSIYPGKEFLHIIEKLEESSHTKILRMEKMEGD